MELATGDRLRRLLCREAMRRGATLLPYAPLEIYVDPASVCDLRCTFCPQSSWGERQRGLMDFDLFERVLAEAAALRPRRLNLFCYGESLLHGRIFDMIRAASDRGLRVRIHTNAQSLDETKSRALLGTGLAEMHLSFDTADRDLYNRLRVRSDFDRVLANIRRFLELRREGGHALPEVHVQEMVPFRRGTKPRNSEAYRALFEGHGVRFHARYMHSFAGGSTERDFPGLEAEGESRCRQIYTRIVVSFDGKVHACCLDAEGHNIVGDLAKGDTIASSWNGPAMQRLRARTNARELEGLRPCDKCDMLRLGPADQRLGARRLLGRLLWRIHAPKE